MKYVLTLLGMIAIMADVFQITRPLSVTYISIKAGFHPFIGWAAALFFYAVLIGLVSKLVRFKL